MEASGAMGVQDGVSRAVGRTPNCYSEAAPGGNNEVSLLLRYLRHSVGA